MSAEAREGALKKIQIDGLDKVIVEANGVTPYLPLPEMRRRAPAAPAADQPPPATPPRQGGGQ